MSREEGLAYAAGLIDGEGCIGVYLNKVYNHYQLRLQVQMCDKEGLDILFNLFGGNFYYTGDKPPRRAKWTWLLLNKKAEEAITELLPYLKVKTKQAKESLKANWHTYNSNNPLTSQEQEIRKKVSENLREFNKRGTN